VLYFPLFCSSWQAAFRMGCICEAGEEEYCAERLELGLFCCTVQEFILHISLVERHENMQGPCVGVSDDGWSSPSRLTRCPSARVGSYRRSAMHTVTDHLQWLSGQWRWSPGALKSW
jgi:hypothetical protein